MAIVRGDGPKPFVMAAPPRVRRQTAKSPWPAPGLRPARTRRRARLGLFRTVRVGGLSRLYTLLSYPNLREGELELRFSPGVSGYAFTFG